MIQGAVSNNSITNIGYAIGASSNGKIALPVDPGSLIYSHLKNVSGIPAPEGSNGINISRLNILDVLIEQIRQIRETPEIITEDLPVYMQDAMIDSIQSQILYAMESRSEMPYVQAPLAESGTLFSISF